jgi:glutamate carboxypeptidase
LNELASHRGFSNTLIADTGNSFHANRVTPPGFHINFYAELIPGQDGPPKTGALDTGKHHQLLIAILYFGQQQGAAGLSNGFDNQHSGHDRQARKMAGKKWLIDADILDSDNALFVFEIDHAIDHQKRKTMWQNAANFVDVQSGFHWRCNVDFRVNSVGHSGLIRRNDYTVPLREGCLRRSFWKGFMARKSQLIKPRAPAPGSAMARRLHYFVERQNEITETIRQLVEIESPSDNKHAVDHLGSMLAGRFEALGGHAKFHRAQDYGNHLQVDFEGQRGNKPILLLGHLDTVYPLGTLAEMPCRAANGRLYGPGTLDMKSGIALMLHAIAALRAWHNDAMPRPVTVLLVSDEEVGSSSSRRITESVAKNCAEVLVLEPSYGLQGAVKTARKGVGEYTVKITGKAAHAGLNPEKGQSAIVELAKQILQISNLVDLKRGLKLNVGVVHGGTRTNVIPAEAKAVVDVRVARMKDAPFIDRKLRSLKPFNRNCKLEITGALNRPPLERSESVVALYKKASGIAKQLGFKLEEAAVGGGSDGNFTAALGIPTLDGLGGVGEGAHAKHESIVIAPLPKRAALLAALIEVG